MGYEIERKFLVTPDWPKTSGTLYQQGYLQRSKGRIVRVRIAGQQGFLTVKGQAIPNDGNGIQRPEFEYSIPLSDAQMLLQSLCEKPILEKIRHRISYQGWIWEIDEFLGLNQGLVVAEIELPTSDACFPLPPWIGQEVSYDPRYFNSNLIVQPYSTWQFCI